MSDLVGRQIATDLVVCVVMGFCEGKREGKGRGGEEEVETGCVWIGWGKVIVYAW
jgi:hypothetical protein